MDLGLTAEQYARMLRALLPPGKLWRTGPDTLLGGIFLACGDELVRVTDRAADLIEESDPRTADELLPEYETELGLTAEGTTDQRRAAVVARLLLLLGRRVRPVDFQRVFAPLLGLDEADVDVIERGRAFAVAVGDDQEFFRFFIYRDPDLPGDYDVTTAQAFLDRMAHTHTKGHVIESVNFLCDDPHSLCDRDLLGA